MTIRAPMDRVVEVMTKPEHIKESIHGLEAAERIDDQTYRWLHAEVHEKGVRFRGDRTVTYIFDGVDRLTWSTVSNGNMLCRGEARFRAEGDGRTTVEFRETIECDMQVNRLLAKVFKPIVERHIRQGVGQYLDRVRQRLEAAS